MADKGIQTSDAALTFSRNDADYVDDYQSMGWKGFEESQEDPESPGCRKVVLPDDEMDMTPMVDVTFLLLIFFMVTASFSLQKSIPMPEGLSDQHAQAAEPDESAITVLIDQNNTYHVVSHNEGEFECPSEREMRQRLRDSVESGGLSRMLIRAHVDSRHGRLVAAWDGGVLAGVEDIAIETTFEEL